MGLAQHWAAFNGHLEIVKHLVQFLDDKNPADKDGQTPLHWAATHCHLDIVKHLVPFLKDVNPRTNSKSLRPNKTPFDFAKENGKTEVVEILKPYQKKKGLMSKLFGK